MAPTPDPGLAQQVAAMDPAHFAMAVAAAVAAALAGAYVAWRFFRHLRLIADTPTAKIRSAHQGYLELEGSAELMDGDPVLSPLTLTRCCWYRFKVEEKEVRHTSKGSRTSWRTIRRGVSDDLFLLVDDTGRCVVDPEGASVTPSEKNTWYGSTPTPQFGPQRGGGFSWLGGGGNFRYTEEVVGPGDHLYALGLLRTQGGAGDLGDAREEVRATLAQWKKDPARMRAFDTDGDGNIDLQEWEAARRAAHDEVVKARAERAASAGTDLLMKPRDSSRPYILSTVPQEALVRRYRWYTGGGLALFFAAGGAAAWLLGVRLG